MKLTPLQKKEIEHYIKAASKYRETYNEVYDHVLNAVENLDEPYQLETVGRIIKEDFGTFKEIKKMENRLFSKMKWKYLKSVFLNMITFKKLSDVGYDFLLVLFCFLLYIYISRNQTNISLLYIFVMSLSYLIAVVWLIINKHIKFRLDRSAKGEIVGWLLLLPFAFFPTTFLLFFSTSGIINITESVKSIILSSLLLITAIYIKSFLNIYRIKIRFITTLASDELK